MITVELWTKSEEQVKQMGYLLKNRKMSTDLIDELPHLGYIAYETYEDLTVVICAGFLREVEGGYVMYDSFISRPGYDAKPKHLAFSMILDKLEADCKMSKVKKILMFTNAPTIKTLALEKNFHMLPHEMGIKVLKV